jgi:hypothetical protein
MPAYAGAWIAPEGGQEIWTTAAGQRNELTFYESSAYWEAPLDDNASIVAAPWLEQNYDTLEGWRGEATLGLKRTVFRDGATVMAVQAGALWISHPPIGCGEGGAELRWLGGRSFENGAFLNAEIAMRALDGGCGGERLDLTAGFRPRENWLAMGQVFADLSRDGEESVRAQLSLVRFGESGRGIQIGVRARVDDAGQEPALVIGWWGRPGD